MTTQVASAITTQVTQMMTKTALKKAKKLKKLEQVQKPQESPFDGFHSGMNEFVDLKFAVVVEEPNHTKEVVITCMVLGKHVCLNRLIEKSHSIQLRAIPIAEFNVEMFNVGYSITPTKTVCSALKFLTNPVKSKNADKQPRGKITEIKTIEQVDVQSIINMYLCEECDMCDRDSYSYSD